MGKQWDGKSRGGRAGYMFFIGILRFLGIPCAYVLLSFVVLYFIPFAPKATRSIWNYNRKIRGLGRLASVRELYMHYFTFGMTLIDKLAMKGGLERKYRFEFDNYERFLEIINGNHGVVIIGAHIGCWEAGAGFFGKYGKKINIVMYDTEHADIKDVVQENSTAEAMYKIIPLNLDPLDAMLKIKIALNEGEYVCFNGDRYVDENSSVTRDFLGHQAMMPLGPFKIASRCGVPTVFYFAMREGRRTYRFIFEEAAQEGRITAQQLQDQYAESLERVVKRYPRQWFNFYKYWN